MLFTDASFLYFILILFALYYFKPLLKYQIQLLILASFIFYFLNSHAFTLLLVFSVGINVFFSWMIIRSTAYKTRKTYVNIGVIINVFLLVFFKYGFMLASSVFNEPSPVYNFFYLLAMPIGISFFTFEGISLLVDTYKTRNNISEATFVKPRLADHIKGVMLFISFFPHLISGPILRANHFFPQLKSKFVKDIDFEYAFKKLVLGFFLKLVVSNNLQNFTSFLHQPYMNTLSSLTLFVLIAGFTFQLFADFAGYSYIALGLAALFGYKLEDNFNFPFVSSTLTELWRRWHITLSSFLRYYVYTNLLGGGRKGKIMSLINIFLTMVIAGLWHGARWPFAIWGAIQGGALVFEHLAKRLMKDWPFAAIRRVAYQIFAMFFIIIPCMALFRFPTLDDSLAFAKLFLNNTIYADDNYTITYTLIYSFPVIFMHVLYGMRNRPWVKYLFTKADYLVYGPLLFLILTNSGQTTSFIYFKF
jgi:alginate O-acetyltransferase complex protein AlgI